MPATAILRGHLRQRQRRGPRPDRERTTATPAVHAAPEEGFAFDPRLARARASRFAPVNRSLAAARAGRWDVAGLPRSCGPAVHPKLTIRSHALLVCGGRQWARSTNP